MIPQNHSAMQRSFFALLLGEVDWPDSELLFRSFGMAGNACIESIIIKRNFAFFLFDLKKIIRKNIGSAKALSICESVLTRKN